MRMHKIDMLLNFVRNPRKSLLLVKKAFLAKLRLIQRHGSQKNLTKRLKTVFFLTKVWYSKG